MYQEFCPVGAAANAALINALYRANVFSYVSSGLRVGRIARPYFLSHESIFIDI